MAAAPLIVAGLAAAASAGVAYAGAQQQASAARRSINSQRQAAAIQQAQLTDAATIERTKRIREANTIRAQILQRAAESGAGATSYAALENQNTYDLNYNLNTLDRSLYNQRRAVETGAQANIDQLGASIHNPFLSAFSGGLQGASAGLSIYTGLRSIPSSTTAPGGYYNVPGGVGPPAPRP